MLELARPVLQRLLGRPFRAAAPALTATVALVRSEAELRREAILIGREAGITVQLAEHWLRELHGAGAPGLFVSLRHGRGARTRELLIAHRPGHDVVFSARGRQARASFEEPAPDGAYLQAREWRRLGHYEVPPGEPVVVVVRAGHVTAGPCIIDVPEYVRRATVLADGALLVSRALLARDGELRVRGG